MRNDVLCPICDKSSSECTCRKPVDKNAKHFASVLKEFTNIDPNTRCGVVHEGFTWDSIEGDDVAEVVRRLLGIAEHTNITLYIGHVDPRRKHISIDVPDDIDVVDFTNMITAILDDWEDNNG